MNRRNMLKTTLGGAAALGLGSMTGTAAAEGKVRLRMQSYWGKEAKDIFSAFTDNVKTATDGAIRIKRYEGSSIVPDADMMSAVSKGTLDMCEGYGGYWPGKIDVAAIESGLPGAWTSYEEALHIFKQAGLQELVAEAYAENNIHYLGPMFGGDYDLLTKKEVKSLDDLKTMKIRATPTTAKVLQQLDIPTVFMPGSELYVGLSTGAIDGCIFGGPLEYKTMKLYEAAKHYTRLNMLNPGYTDNLLINKDKWDSFSDAQRKILEMAVETHTKNMHNWIVAGNIEARAEGLFEFGALSEEDSGRLLTASQKVWAEEAEKSERNKKAIDILNAVAKANGRV